MVDQYEGEDTAFAAGFRADFTAGGAKSIGRARIVSHLSTSRCESETLLVSAGTGMRANDSEHAASSLPARAAKLSATTFSGETTMSPEKEKRPAPEVSKLGLVPPSALQTELTKSLSRPVSTLR